MSTRKMLLCLVLICHLLCASSSIIGNTSRTQPMKTGDSHGITSVSQSEYLKIKCLSSHDPVYGGHLVDCSNLGITSVNQILISDPHKTTTLLLDHNDISCLHNMSFHPMEALRKLSIRHSQVKTIQVNALYGLKYLEVLDLEYNKLSLSTSQSFPHGMFDHVPNVQHLFIAYNMRDSHDDGSYENIDIFSSLPGLQTLSIDAFSLLDLDKVFFKNLTELVNLTVGCTLTKFLTNDSLIGIQNSTLLALSLVGFEKSIDRFENGLFENLSKLDFLKIVNCKVGNKNMMKTMYPFENRTMSLVHIEGSNYNQIYGTPDYTVADGTIDKETLKSLLTVCLEKFIWSDSNIFAFKPSTLMYAHTWHSCLKYLDFSRNRWDAFGWRIIIFQLQPFFSLREVILSSRLTSWYVTHPVLINFTLSNISDTQKYPSKLDSTDSTRLRELNKKRITRDNHSEAQSKGELQNIGVTSNWDYFKPNSINPRYKDAKLLAIKDYGISHTKNNDDYYYGRPHNLDFKDNANTALDLKSLYDSASNLGSSYEDHDVQEGSGRITANFSFYVPPSIEVVRFVEVYTGMNQMRNCNYIFRNTKNLKELYWINNYMMKGQSRLFGLSHIKLLDISMSMFMLRSDFFDNFRGLKVFVAKAMRPDSFFDNTPVERMIRNMPNLRYLDLSNNKLNIFPPGTFSLVPNLTHLILSKNRFTSLAFDLTSTSSLRYLDLSANAILFLDEHDTQALDQHLARKNVPHLTLDLRNNSIACGCEQLAFLVWLYKTEVNVLDKEKLMCTYNDGRLIPVFSIDIMHFWRTCQGRVMLLGSVILFTVMTVAFLIACLVNRFRFSLEAYALRLFSKWFRPMEPSDYKIHTFIGYADDDFRFVRYILRVYLEDKLGVTTYIHQRDLRAGSMDQQFLTAITNSWRIVLVLSENFLQRYSMSHLMMKYASHTVSAMNQGRVFVLVEESQLHVIPDYLDCVLDDNKVIILSDLHSPLDYRQRERIKDCLRP